MPSGEPWIVLRAVVEVKVPPKTPATDKDLIAAVKAALPIAFELPNGRHPRRKFGVIRVVSFKKLWPPIAKAAQWVAPKLVRVPADQA